MNISSVVIYLGADTDIAAFRKELQSIGGCEFVACEDGKAVGHQNWASKRGADSGC